MSKVQVCWTLAHGRTWIHLSISLSSDCDNMKHEASNLWWLRTPLPIRTKILQLLRAYGDVKIFLGIRPSILNKSSELHSHKNTNNSLCLLLKPNLRVFLKNKTTIVNLKCQKRTVNSLTVIHPYHPSFNKACLWTSRGTLKIGGS